MAFIIKGILLIPAPLKIPVKTGLTKLKLIPITM